MGEGDGQGGPSEKTCELRPGGRLCASETKAPLLPVKKFRKDALIFLWEP